MKAPPNINISYLLPFLTTLFFPNAAQVQQAFSTFGRGVQKEIQAAKQPIDETIAFVGSSQCTNVKKLIGVDYEQVTGVKEPDFNELSLNFRSREITVTYNLSSAPRLLAEERGFDPKANLIIYIHGFTDDPTSKNFGNISEAFLKIGEFNILGLDASSLIRWLYLRSTTYTKLIGQRLAEVLAIMVNKGLDPRSIHLIGHSLGSHIAGFTGKHFKKLTGLLVGRISGLDPAGPCFSHVEPQWRLKATDAHFVDVTHTDNGVYGLDDTVGHVDFYPNGGSQQPNCLLQTCSHGRVNLLYSESIINPEAFVGKKCSDWDAFKKNKCEDDIRVMGYYCQPDTRGKYFLRTGEDPPYGLGANGTRWVNNQALLRNVGEGIGSGAAAIFG